MICRFLLLFAALGLVARADVVIDASAPTAAPQPLAFAAGGRSPDGHVLGINQRYFTRDGRPWFPVMGEFHFARYPAAEWDAELEKMKAGGIEIVGTYVFWIFHEEKPGVFDWSGQRDLRRFVEACGRHGLAVWLRVGPWCHGEVRNGGLPDWLIAAGPVRESTPGYLTAVQRFFGEIGRQVKGQFWQDGGPIVGVQLENEYHPAHDGEAHMLKLLELARGAGLDAPFYTATGWDKAVVPANAFLPVFGGYTEQFWSDSRTALPPNQNFFFTSIRAEDNVGYLLTPKDQAYHDRYLAAPYLTAEMGGGMAFSYHRRGVLQAADSTAAALVKLGSGVTLLGYYMYHGGTNPDAAGPLQETLTAWNGYNELEVKSYDFQAPLGEFGQVRETYRTMRALHLFLHDFGAELAPMTARFPAQAPRSLDDSITPRVAVRSDGRAAFVFINNHQRDWPLPAHRDFQVTVQLANGSVTLPREPITLPSGVFTHWTVNLPLGTSTLRSATAQLLCRLPEPDTYVFAAAEGVPAEFVVVPGEGITLTAATARVVQDASMVVVTEVTPGRGPAFTLRAGDGRVTTVLLLSAADALNLSKEQLGGKARLLLTRASSWQSGAGVILEGPGVSDLSVAVYPALANVGAGYHREGTTGVFAEYAANVGSATLGLPRVRAERSAGTVRSIPINPDPKRRVALEPSDADFIHAAAWKIDLPDDVVADASRALLRIPYIGDVARLYAGERLLDDNFYRGTPMEFGLWRLTPEERKAGLTLKVLPLQRGEPVYLPRDAWPQFGSRAAVSELGQPTIERSVTATLEAGGE